MTDTTKAMKRTARGFGIYTEFKDSFNSTVRVQESSNVKAACWIFTNSNQHDGLCSPHLTPNQARRVARALLRFADAKTKKRGE